LQVASCALTFHFLSINRFSDVNATISVEKSKEMRWAIPIFAENEKRWMLYEND
jgi:hypothetical protein